MDVVVGNGINVRAGGKYTFFTHGHLAVGEMVRLLDQGGIHIGSAICVKRHEDGGAYIAQPFSDPRRQVKLPKFNFGKGYYDVQITEVCK